MSRVAATINLAIAVVLFLFAANLADNVAQWFWPFAWKQIGYWFCFFSGVFFLGCAKTEFRDCADRDCSPIEITAALPHKEPADSAGKQKRNCR